MTYSLSLSNNRISSSFWFPFRQSESLEPKMMILRRPPVSEHPLSTPAPASANHERPAESERGLRTFEFRPPRGTHAPALSANFQYIVNQVFTYSKTFFSSPLSFILSTWQFCFVLFIFVQWPHWRWSVYFQYGRLFTVSTC